MRYTAGRFDLNAKALQALRVMRQLLWQEFEGYRLAERQIVGPEDFAHTAFAECCNDAKTIGNDLAGSESLAAVSRTRWGARGRRSKRCSWLMQCRVAVAALTIGGRCAAVPAKSIAADNFGFASRAVARRGRCFGQGWTAGKIWT